MDTLLVGMYHSLYFLITFIEVQVYILEENLGCMC